MQYGLPSYHSDISDESSYCLLIDWLSVLVAAGGKEWIEFQHEKKSILTCQSDYDLPLKCQSWILSSQHRPRWAQSQPCPLSCRLASRYLYKTVEWRVEHWLNKSNYMRLVAVLRLLLVESLDGLERIHCCQQWKRNHQRQAVVRRERGFWEKIDK